eukprot:GSChrysophyteH1.ASY1.ANO1.131.1 assembled CDS
MFSGVNPFGGGDSSGSSSTGGDDKKGSSSKSSKSASGTSAGDFNSTGLERAAKAAKELERSSNSREILRVTAQQEVTKQKEHEADRAKFKAMEQELAIKRVAEEEQAAMRIQEKKTQHQRQQADYQDSLERKRIAEESLRRQEEIRKRTIEYEAELRQQTEMARVKAETEGRILQERKNFDLTVDLKKVEAAEFRDTIIEGIKIAGTTIGTGLKEFISDKEKLANFAGTATILALGIYTAKTGTGIAGRFIEARLGKPTLVRETSKKNVIQMFKNPISTARMLFSSKGEEAAAMKGIVLEKSLDERLRRVAISTANTKANRAPFRHLLLHGPPGTGKTMFAKGLARESGLHYAIMTGGDIAPLGKDAVTEIHKIFDWANTTNKGVMLFVDEADAFLRKRSTEKISEDMRNSLNAFLYRTGEASDKIMLVYASNQPEQFDWAINDRIDEMVEFALPESIKEMAIATEGFSGREISKLAIAWQAAAFGTADATLNTDMLREVLQQQLRSKEQKKKWLSQEEVNNLVRDQEM